MVQERVKLQGGEVRVRSPLSRGTPFTVLIPTGTAHLPRERIGGARTLASTAMRATPFVEKVLRWLP